MRIFGNSILNQALLTIFVASHVISACSPLVTKPISTTPAINKTDTPFQPGVRFTQTEKPTETPELTLTSTPLPYLNILPESLAGVRVRLWHPWSGNTSERLESLVDEFNRTNEWGILVEPHAPGSSGELYNQAKASLDDDSKPHIVTTSIEQLLSLEQIQKDILVDLNGYINSKDWGMSEKEIANIPVKYLDKSLDEKELLGMPAQRSLQVLFYNQTWAKELGFDTYPETFSEFAEQACAAAQANLKDSVVRNDGTGGWIVTNDGLAMLSWIEGFGNPRLPTEETLNYDLNNPVVLDAFTALRKIYDDNCAWISRNPQPYDYFANREALFYSGVLQDIEIQNRTQSRLEKIDQWTVIPYPMDESKPVLILSGPSYAILRSSYIEQMAAWLFIRWLTQADQEARMIEVTSTLPVSLSTTENLIAYGEDHPQWKQTLTWLPIEQPAPKLASWRVVRNILEDATWQLFYTDQKIDQIPNILEQLDDMIYEVLSREEE